MASFVIVTPPGEPEKTADAVIIRDGFSIGALFFHVFWLLWHRLWYAAALVLLCVVGLIAAGEIWTQWAPLMAISIVLLFFFVGLEANGLRVSNLERRDWRVVDIIEAPDAATAEDIYTISASEPAKPAPPSGSPTSTAAKPAQTGKVWASENGPALGLLGGYGKS